MPDDKKDEKKEECYPLDVDREPVTTDHQVGDLRYIAHTGMLPLTSPTGEVEAGIFFIAYLKKDPEPGRPLTFSFNGGPGSSSVWLHLGAVGPKRVEMLEDGALPPPPYKLVDNPDTWLHDTDLVFIDPVGTGYSRPKKKEDAEKYWSLKGDIESIGDFIRLFLTRYQRWASPLFLVGESYGTTRAAGLAGHLIERGIAFNGILLVSSILNFQTARFGKGNDLPYILFLPTYTATAWYHGRLDEDLQRDLRKALREVEEWAAGEYTLALGRGDSLQGEERREIARKLARYTGLSERYVDLSDLRIGIHRFCKELLRDERRTVGRLDSRFKGIDASGVTDQPDFDPSMTAIRPPYTAMFNDYVRRSLGYVTDVPYNILGEEGKLWEKWNWGSAGEGHPDTSEALREALVKNPWMRLFVASGYYDLATPYFATEYTLDHLGLDPSLRENLRTEYYEAGHMMYVHMESLRKLKANVGQFIAESVRNAAP
jgi:carboxypeptidase C (cathepsin A)